MKSLSQILTTTLSVIAGGIVVLHLTWGQASPALPVARAESNNDTACDNTRTAQVSGAAAINVTPDRALLQLGVTSTAPTPEEVEAENTAAIKNIIAAVRQLGVADKDIATDYYLVQPIYVDYETMRIEGYRISNVVGITLDDVSQTGEVLIAALKAGANEVREVQFYTSQLRRYRDEARKLAMQAATEKAALLAGAGGTQTGCVLNISENSWSYYNGSWWAGRDRAMWSQNVVQNATSEQPMPDETPISVGQIVVRAEVSASFGLE
ncbi:MAG: hypothetical protein DPW09_14725 [Anaerolineae bacterium]|nr:hypothetical protein [Anaerolineae bacterium]